MNNKPDQLLKLIQKQQGKTHKGTLKIYLGMVAGVGKTTAMLKEAHALKKLGKKVIVGLVETHGRKETEILLQDLDVLPRFKVRHKEVEFSDLDLDAIIKLKPDYVLVDELAHTNVPGMRHAKRYQDIIELMDHGVNVLTTMNIQHLESRFETVSSFTKTLIQEVVPDSIFDQAQEVVLVDLNPEEIQTRLKEGKIYSQDKIQTSLLNFFKLENLTALREISLRFMTERVDNDLREIEILGGQNEAHKINHKFMVAIYASPYSDTLIRYTRKLAYALNAKWYAIYIKQSRSLDEEEEILLQKNLETVRRLGGEIVYTEGDNISQVMIDEAKKLGVTQMVVGQSLRRKNWLTPWKRSITTQLIEKSEGIDIHFLSPEKSLMANKKKPGVLLNSFKGWWEDISLSSYATTTIYIFFATIVNFFILSFLHYRAIGLIFLLQIFLGSILVKRFHFFWASCLTSLTWNFFFIPPLFTWVIHSHEDLLMFFSFLFVGLVTGRYLKKLKQNEERLLKETQITRTLFKISEDLIASLSYESFLQRLASQLKAVFSANVGVVAILDEDMKSVTDLVLNGKDETILNWCITNGKEAGKLTQTLTSSNYYFTPVIHEGKVIAVLFVDLSEYRVFFEEKRIIWDTSLRLIHLSYEHHLYILGREKNLLSSESEKIYKTLLNSISHELRTPLAAVKGFTVNLKNQLSDSKELSYTQEILIGVERLEDLVKNILDINRIESGLLKLKKDYCDLFELTQLAIQKVSKYYGNRNIKIISPTDLPFLFIDSYLIQQCLENLIKNAFQYGIDEKKTSHDVPDILIEIKNTDKKIELIVRDFGKGISDENLLKIFNKFFRVDGQISGGLGLGLSITKSIIEMHKGHLLARNVFPQGVEFVIQLPKEEGHE